jgi:ribosomal protein L39E
MKIVLNNFYFIQFQLKTFRIAHKSHLKQNFYSSLFFFRSSCRIKNVMAKATRGNLMFPVWVCVWRMEERQAERHFSKPESALESIEFNENLIGFHKFILLLPQCCLSIFLLYIIAPFPCSHSAFFSSSNFDCPLRLLVTSTQNNLYKLYSLWLTRTRG